jgi:hypothetical protein
MTDLDPTDATEAAERAFVRSMFATDEPDDTTGTDETDEHKPPVGNFVPREGNIPQSRDNTDAQFVRDLFDN